MANLFGCHFGMLGVVLHCHLLTRSCDEMTCIARWFLYVSCVRTFPRTIFVKGLVYSQTTQHEYFKGPLKHFMFLFERGGGCFNSLWNMKVFQLK